METTATGRVLVTARIESLRDLYNAQRKLLDAAEVRSVEVSGALMDTGAGALRQRVARPRQPVHRRIPVIPRGQHPGVPLIRVDAGVHLRVHERGRHHREVIPLRLRGRVARRPGKFRAERLPRPPDVVRLVHHPPAGALAGAPRVGRALGPWIGIIPLGQDVLPDGGGPLDRGPAEAAGGVVAVQHAQHRAGVIDRAPDRLALGVEAGDEAPVVRPEVADPVAGDADQVQVAGVADGRVGRDGVDVLGGAVGPGRVPRRAGVLPVVHEVRRAEDRGIRPHGRGVVGEALGRRPGGAEPSAVAIVRLTR